MFNLPQMRAVKSSNVGEVGYDSVTHSLYVSFKKGGRVYRYRGVSQDEFNRLAQAKSPGQYIAQHIRGKFDFDKE